MKSDEQFRREGLQGILLFGLGIVMAGSGMAFSFGRTLEGHEPHWAFLIITMGGAILAMLGLARLGQAGD
jgi:hypothetical protein